MLCCCCCCVGNWTLRCIDGENALTEQIEMGKFSFTIIVHLQCVILDFLNVSMVLIDRLLFPETKTVPIIPNSICGLRRNFEANAYCIWNVSTFSSNFDRKTIAGMSAINRSIHVPPRLPLFGANILSSIAISENIQSNTHTLHTRG